MSLFCSCWIVEKLCSAKHTRMRMLTHDFRFVWRCSGRCLRRSGHSITSCGEVGAVVPCGLTLDAVFWEDLACDRHSELGTTVGAEFLWLRFVCAFLRSFPNGCSTCGVCAFLVVFCTAVWPSALCSRTKFLCTSCAFFIVFLAVRALVSFYHCISA